MVFNHTILIHFLYIPVMNERYAQVVFLLFTKKECRQKRILYSKKSLMNEITFSSIKHDKKADGFV